MNLVITSYSIHYTKLYDDRQVDKAVGLQRRLVEGPARQPDPALDLELFKGAAVHVLDHGALAAQRLDRLLDAAADIAAARVVAGAVSYNFV